MATADDETRLLLLGQDALRAPLGPYAMSHLALDAANFFIADAASLGALSFIYCTASEASGGLAMNTGLAGAILMLQGAFGVVAGPPLGWYIDKSRQKKKILSCVCGVIAATWLLLAVTRSYFLVAVLLSIQGLAGAVFPPGICGLSLGIVGYAGFPTRTGRNEMWKHSGAVVGALTPIMVVKDNYAPLFIIFAAAMALSIVSINMIRDRDIDHELASGLKKGKEDGVLVEEKTGDADKAKTDQTSTIEEAPIKDFFLQHDVLIFLAMVVLWHFANAPMLPSVGFKIQEIYEEDPDTAERIVIGAHSFPLDGKNGISLATIVAHIVMIPVAKASGMLATMEWAGSKRTLMVATAFIVVRAVAFALMTDPWALLVFCFLDGLSAGAFGVLAVLMVGDLAVGSGHANVLQGAMAACIGMGASVSNGIFGAVTEAQGVDVTFWWLAAFGCLAVVLLVTKVKDMHDYETTSSANDPMVWESSSPRKANCSLNPTFERQLTMEGKNTIDTELNSTNDDGNSAARVLFPQDGGEGDGTGE